MPFERDEFDRIGDLFMNDDDLHDKYYKRGVKDSFSHDNIMRRSYRQGIKAGNQWMDLQSDDDDFEEIDPKG